MAIQQKLLKGPGEEYLFDDDPDAAEAFGAQLSDFVMKSSTGNFSEEYCEFVANFASRVNPKPPLSAFVATVGIIGTWITESLTNAIKDDPEKLSKMLSAWQKLLAINLELLTTDYSKS